MQIMMVTLVSTVLISLLSRNMEERKKKVGAIFFIFFVACILILVPALRTNIGDTYVYVSSYRQMNGLTLQDIFTKFGDVGYYVLMYFLHKISSDPQIMIFVTSLVTQVCYFIFFYKYRSMIELEVFMYIASGYYFVTMNGIRQSLASAILLLGTKYIINRNFKKYLIVVLISSIFHQSALIMILIYFVSIEKAWSKKMFIMVGVAAIGAMLFNELMPILFKLLQGSNYAHYEEVFESGLEEGANVLRVAVAFVPLLLAFLKRKKLENWKSSNVFINMAVVNFIFMIFSLQTWIFARFTIYFNPYNCVLLPYTIRVWDNKKEKRCIYAFFIICYLIFFLIEQRTAERINSIFNISWFLM